MSTANVTIQPYLFFGGHCEEALNFYRDAIGAEVLMMMRFRESPEPPPVAGANDDKIMHASVRVGETIFMASDGRCEGEPKFDGFCLSITVPDEAEAKRVFGALSAGGKVEMPLSPTFWAPLFGILEDRFTLGWMVSVQHKP